MIVVTGAGGKTGKAVIKSLENRGAQVRALVHHTEQKQNLLALGAQEVAAGDMSDSLFLKESLKGAQAIYHICPNMDPDEFSIGQRVIHAAREAGLSKFVYHSVLHPQIEAMPHHWQKLRVEEKLFESGLLYVILQPAAYMQNVLAYWERMVREGVYALPYAPETRLSMVDLNDVAEAAAIVLTEDGFIGGIFELCGPDRLNQDEIAKLIGQRLGKVIRNAVIPLHRWEAQARSSGLDEYARQTLMSMFKYYEQYGFWGNSQVLGWLLGRPPVDFATFVTQVIHSPD